MPRMVRKLPISRPCCPWVGSTAVTKPRPSCWAITEPATASADSVTRAVAPQDDQRQEQRDRKLDAHRDVALAKSRQQHHHGAHAGEHQHEGGGKGRQQRYVDAHSSTMHQPPMIRDDIRIMWPCIESAMNGKASNSVTD